MRVETCVGERAQMRRHWCIVSMCVSFRVRATRKDGEGVYTDTFNYLPTYLPQAASPKCRAPCPVGGRAARRPGPRPRQRPGQGSAAGAGGGGRGRPNTGVVAGWGLCCFSKWGREDDVDIFMFSKQKKKKGLPEPPRMYTILKNVTHPCAASLACSSAQPSRNDAPGPPTSPSSNSSPSPNMAPRAVSLFD